MSGPASRVRGPLESARPGPGIICVRLRIKCAIARHGTGMKCVRPGITSVRPGLASGTLTRPGVSARPDIKRLGRHSLLGLGIKFVRPDIQVNLNRAAFRYSS